MAKYNLVSNLKTTTNNDYIIRGTNATLEDGTIATSSNDNTLATTKWVYTNFGIYKTYKCSDYSSFANMMAKINSDAPRVAEINWDANFESYSQSFIGSKFYRDGKLVIFGNKCDYSIRNLLIIGASDWYSEGGGWGFENARATSQKVGFNIETYGSVSLSVYAYMSNQINIIIHGVLYGGFKTYTPVPRGNGYHSTGATSGSINFIFDKNIDSSTLCADLELGSHYHWYGFNAIGNYNTMKAYDYNYYFRLVKFTTETETDDQGVETTKTVITNVDGTIPVSIDSDFRNIIYSGDKTLTITPSNGARIIFPYSTTNGFTLGQTPDVTTANGRIIQQS